MNNDRLELREIVGEDYNDCRIAVIEKVFVNPHTEGRPSTSLEIEFFEPTECCIGLMTNPSQEDVEELITILKSFKFRLPTNEEQEKAQMEYYESLKQT